MNLRNVFNPLNAELNPIRHLLALVGGRHIVHVRRIRVNKLTLASRQYLWKVFTKITRAEK